MMHPTTMPRHKSDNQSFPKGDKQISLQAGRTGKDGNNRFMHRSNLFNLEVVRSDQSPDQENAENTETPSVKRPQRSAMARGTSCARKGRVRGHTMRRTPRQWATQQADLQPW